MPQADIEAWRRILAKRRDDCQKLQQEAIMKILHNPVFKREPKEAPKASLQHHEKILWVLKCMLHNSMNDKKDPESRRREFINLKMLLKSIDSVATAAQVENSNSDNLNKENGSILSNSLIETNKKMRGSNNSPLSANNNSVTLQNKVGNTKSAQVGVIDPKTVSASQIAPTKTPQLSANQNQNDALQTDKNQISSFRNDNAIKLRNNGSTVPLQKVPLTESEIKKPWPIKVPPISIATQPKRISAYELWFPEDEKKISGALDKRSRHLLKFRDCVLSQHQVNTAIHRFYKWDPYWEVLEILTLTQTSAIDEAVHSCKNEPKHAVSFSIKIPSTYEKLIHWGKHISGSYENGKVRLLLRMIPCVAPEKKLSKKKARADYHLWPKGTLLCVNDFLPEIQQRRQQSHDRKEWKGASKLLDLTQYIRRTGNNTIKASILDPEAYFVSVAVCKYHSHEQLYASLMRDSIKKLSKELSIQLAVIHAKNKKAVCLDDDSSNNADDKTYEIIKLTCVLSSGLMKTPVRAAQCHHFQCFDLWNFLSTNQNVTGTRWECPVCNNELISVYDLQHCGLTAHMLEQYKGRAKADARDSVQFFSDGSWNLMAEKRKRYDSEERRPDVKKKKPAQEVISID